MRGGSDTNDPPWEDRSADTKPDDFEEVDEVLLAKAEGDLRGEEVGRRGEREVIEGVAALLQQVEGETNSPQKSREEAETEPTSHLPRKSFLRLGEL